MTDTYKLLSAAAAPMTGQPVAPAKNYRTIQAIGKTTAGAGACSVDILGSNTGDATTGVLLGTISLTLGVTATSDGFISTAPWAVIFAKLNSISGTGATVDVVAAS